MQCISGFSNLRTSVKRQLEAKMTVSKNFLATQNPFSLYYSNVSSSHIGDLRFCSDDLRQFLLKTLVWVGWVSGGRAGTKIVIVGMWLLY